MVRSPDVTRPPLWWRAIASAAALLAAMLTFSSSVSPNVPWRAHLLESLEPATVASVAHAAGVAGALVLAVLSWGVLQGRRRAGRVAVVLLAVLAAVHAAKGLDYEEASIALALAFALRAGVRAAARGAAPSPAAAAALITAGALAAGYAVTVTALLVSGRSPEVAATLARAASALAHGRVPARAAAWAVPALHVLVGIAFAGLVLLGRSLLAPARARDGHGWGEHERAAAIVSEHGDDSIAPFLLRADKTFFFARDGVLAYRLIGGTAVMSGDPVGPDAAATLAAFLTIAARRGWDVCAMAARREHIDAYRALGLRAIRIGSEAIVDPAAFSLDGRASRTVRKAVHRVRRHGWTIETLAGAELTPALAAELEAVEREWRTRHPRLYGFAMTSDRLWGAREDAHDVYAVARNEAGAVRAFQRYVPYRGGLSLDAMRRLDDEPNGISDALVASALAEARSRGCREVSLNFSSLAHVLAGDSRAAARARWLLRPLRHRFQLERLARFAAKFGPEWRPRYLVYTRRARLPVAVVRVMQAEAYLRPPRPRPRPDAWSPLPFPRVRG
jgi:lysyl-tRNA synthetase class 2